MQSGLIYVQEDVDAIFRVADKDNSGTLSVKKIKHVLGDIYQRYPQVELYLKTNQMKGFHDLLKDKESEELNIEEFKKALAQVDSQVKMLPATAQVIHTYNLTTQYYPPCIESHNLRFDNMLIFY
jgi:NADH:ubiquinone reductase (non-electrogenic)